MEIKYYTEPVNLGQTFIFRGEYCRVVEYSKNGFGFWYIIPERSNAKRYMSFNSYKKTSSYISKTRLFKKSIYL